MAHFEQQEFFLDVKKVFPGFFIESKVLDVGSLDINGSARQFFTRCEYTGIDVGEGPGVDIVSYGQDFNGPSNYYDVVLSAECYEHNPFWEDTFVNMHRMLRPGGMFLMTCATTGREEHGTTRRAPQDAPLMVANGYNYYKNLEPMDFALSNKVNLRDMFSVYQFRQDFRFCDLYFIGFKR